MAFFFGHNYEKKVLTVMVINSTNINKTNNHHHLSSLLNSLNTEKTTTYDVGNPDPGLGQAQKCGGVKLANEITGYSTAIQYK